MNYDIKKSVEYGFDEAVEKVRAELVKEGFGIITEINVKDTLKEKLDVDFDNYIILGACNPAFAYKALITQRDIGLLLPCNVIIYEKKGTVFVSSINPLISMNFISNADLDEIAKEIRDKLIRVIDKV